MHCWTIYGMILAVICVGSIISILLYKICKDKKGAYRQNIFEIEKITGFKEIKLNLSIVDSTERYNGIYSDRKYSDLYCNPPGFYIGNIYEYTEEYPDSTDMNHL